MLERSINAIQAQVRQAAGSETNSASPEVPQVQGSGANSSRPQGRAPQNRSPMGILLSICSYLSIALIFAIIVFAIDVVALRKKKQRVLATVNR
jgi:subtilase family serine protease